MTATDELRAELTKRGIEWRCEDERTTYWYVTVDGEEWGEWTAIEMGGYLHLSFSSGDVLTPAQAIAATLGPKVCQLKRASWDDGTCTWGCICSACDAHLEHETGIGYNYCPICGARIVEVTA